MRDARTPGAEVAATTPEQPADRESHIANRTSDSEGVSGGASDSGAPPDRAE
jgi:hypothetical protein